MSFMRYTNFMNAFPRLVVILLLLSLLILPTTTVLAVGDDTPGNEFTDGIKSTGIFARGAGLSPSADVFVVITSVLQWLLALSAMLAMAAIVWGGIMYITSLGDESKAGKAKQIIQYAIIGVIVILLSFVIVTLVHSILIS